MVRTSYNGVGEQQRGRGGCGGGGFGRRGPGRGAPQGAKRNFTTFPNQSRSPSEVCLDVD
ncbi:hypothetical protein NW759_011138 [Fusarium solani]|nr:hypothetical protein NW759_011138 [Fusarium solani]